VPISIRFIVDTSLQCEMHGPAETAMHVTSSATVRGHRQLRRCAGSAARPSVAR
jgi:hypothetical protein